MTHGEIEPDLLLLVGTFAVAAVGTLVAGRVATRIGLVDRPAAHKFHQRTTPYLGGVAVAGAVLVLVFGELFVVQDRRIQTLAIGLGGVAMATIGLLDDWKTLAAAPRLAVQALAAVGLWVASVRVGPSGIAAVDLAITVFVVIAVTNAVNLLDNMDGLSAGTVAIGALFGALIALHQGQLLVPELAFSLAGASLGFLVLNFPPAKVFLGDAGTLFMGFVMATLVIEIDLNGFPLVTRIVVPASLVAVPMFDMTLVVVSRLRRGERVFQGGTDHSSHRMLSLGRSPRSVTLMTYAAATASGGAGLLLVLARSEALTWSVLGVGAAAAGGCLVFFESILPRGAGAGASRADRLRSAPLAGRRAVHPLDSSR